MKFFVTKPGGITVKDAGGAIIYGLLEGTNEKGPWYNPDQFPHHYVQKWLDRGDIKFV